MLDVDNNPDVDPVPDELISKGDASYESAWIDKLLGNSDAEDDEPGQVASEALGQSRHNSCQPDISRQDNKSRGIFCFVLHVLFCFSISPLMEFLTEQMFCSGPAVLSPESGLKETRTCSSHQPQTISYVSSKTEDTVDLQLKQDEEYEDIDLNTKDDENNEIQKKILELYLTSKKNAPKNDLVLKQEFTKNNENDPNLNPLKSNDYFEYEMELVLFEENDVSSQLTILEHTIREAELEGSSDLSLLNAWFELVSKKNLIFHRRLMLEIMQNEQDLERKCEMIQRELRKPELEPQREELLLKELLRIVDLRDKLLMEKDDEENILCQEEQIGKQVQQNINVQKQKCKIQ